MTINDQKVLNVNVNDSREILSNENIKKEFSHISKTKKVENFNDLIFNIQSLKKSTDSFIQSIIENNKYLIEYEKKKLKENPDEEEEI